MKIKIKPNETTKKCGQKSSIIMLVKRNFVQKEFWLKKIFGQKKCWSNMFLDPNKFQVQKLFATKNVWFNRIAFENF